MEVRLNISKFILLECVKNFKLKQYINKCTNRYLNGDWGSISEKDSKVNNIIKDNKEYMPVVALYKDRRFPTLLYYNMGNKMDIFIEEVHKDINSTIRRHFMGIII